MLDNFRAISYNKRMNSDYVEQLKSEIEAKDWNRWRFKNEPSEFFDTLWAEVDAWEAEGSFDVFVRKFESKTKWRTEPLFQYRWVDVSNGHRILCQWTLKNGGLQLEFGASRIKQPNPS
jgi:hypothetical protein